MRRQFGFANERWVFYFWFVGWDCFSLGFHISFGAPNFEIHLPFGFIRVGRKSPSNVETLIYVGENLVATWRAAPVKIEESKGMN